jgi:hypothetical protein
MFGLLQGCGCHMRREERQEWMGHICGLCLALRRDHGQVSRLTTNYDAALLSVLCEAQAATPAPRASHFCPLRSGGRADVVDWGQVGARYAAAICVLMAATKIADHVADGEGWFRLLPAVSAGMAGRWTRQARRAAAELGFDAEQIEAQTQRQTALEQQAGGDFMLFSLPTELAAGAAFGHTAVLAGCPANIAPIEQVGRMYGRIMYLLDSYRDYTADIAAGRFNALARSVAPSLVQQQARDLFLHAHATLADHFHQLALPRPDLARKLLLRRLRQIGLQTIDGPLAPGAGPSHAAAIFRRKPRAPRDRGWCCFEFCDCCFCCDCDGCCHGADGSCCDGCNCCDSCNCCDGCSCDCC